MKRLPSFNDFSPVLIGDLRRCLDVIPAFHGRKKEVLERWDDLYFEGKRTKRAGNVSITLNNTGLVIAAKSSIELTKLGEEIRKATSALNAAILFCNSLLQNHNADVLIASIKTLRDQEVPITKASLKAELERKGIEKLSTNTTDHTTLKNWLILAGFLSQENVINEALVKKALGISDEERSDFESLRLNQQVFLQHLRKRLLLGGERLSAAEILKECNVHYSHLFSESQFAKTVREPLVKGGWITTDGLAHGKHGGKSGFIQPTQKLLSIPVERLVPGFNEKIPGDLKRLIRTPSSKIKSDLFSADTHKGGIALELLALRMILDLDLVPKGFRVRSKDTASAEVDLVAEGAHLLFSRWTFQCKRNKASTKVSLGDVAKEVGLAIFTKAHVVVVVTTSTFSKEALSYAKQVQQSTHLQFLLIDGAMVKRYLSDGQTTLIEHVMENAGHIMKDKSTQPILVTDSANQSLGTPIP